MTAARAPEPCRLCGQIAPLRNSHLIPKFVFRWLRSTGGDKHFLRGGDNPNRRVQDGPRERLLCDTCEQKFSKWEDSFADRIFRGYIEREETAFAYGPELSMFVASVLWRGLTTSDYRHSSDYPANVRVQLAATEQHWKAALSMDDSSAFGPEEFHLFMLGIGPADNGAIPVATWNRYMGRTTDITPVLGSRRGDERPFMYAKIPRFAVFGAVTPFAADAFEGTAVNPSGGTLATRQAIKDANVGRFLLDRANDVHQHVATRLSRTQLDLIARTGREQVGSIMASDLGATLLADFSAPVLPPTRPWKTGRNETCPCGSGQKYKRCHGR